MTQEAEAKLHDVLLGRSSAQIAPVELGANVPDDVAQTSSHASDEATLEDQEAQARAVGILPSEW